MTMAGVEKELPKEVIDYINENMKDSIFVSQNGYVYRISLEKLRSFTICFLTKFINGQETYAQQALMNVLGVYTRQGLMRVCGAHGIGLKLDVKV